MCKHILNAQVAVRAPCCQRFFDCPQCHAECSDHPLRKTIEMSFVCKACRRAFRKDLSVFEQADEYCPWCDNCYVISAKTSRRPHATTRSEEQREGDPSSSSTSSTSTSKTYNEEEEDVRKDSTLHEMLDPRMRYDPRLDFHTLDWRRREDGERVDIDGLRGVLQGTTQDTRTRGRTAETKDLPTHDSTNFQKIDEDLDWS